MSSPVGDALDRLREYGYIGAGVVSRWREEVREAEATVRDELQRLRDERDSQDWYTEWYAPMKRRAEAAEAEVQRLTEGLREIAECVPNAGRLDTQPVGIARALLAASTTPARPVIPTGNTSEGR